MIDLFYYDKGLKTAKFSKKTIQSLFSSKKKVWIDCTGAKKEELEIIGEVFKLHPLTKEDLTKWHTRLKFEEFPHYSFIVLYGIYKKKKIELRETDFVIGTSFVISNRREKIKNFDELKNNRDNLSDLFKKGVDFILHKLIDLEIDNYFPVMESLDDEIEDVDEICTKNSDPKVLNRIIEIKRNITLLKKVVFPQRDKIAVFAKADIKFISNDLHPYFRDVYDHAIRVADSVENYREMIGTSYEIYMSSVSNDMNQVMKVLSIIATVMLPLSFLTGLYGMNFTVLPGSKSPYGFWILAAFMVLLVGVMFYFFRRKKWV